MKQDDATVYHTPWLDNIFHAQKSHFTTFHNAQLDARNAADHRIIEIGHHATVFQAKVGGLIFSAQNQVIIMPHSSTELDALNAADHITIQIDHHATVFRAKVEDLIFSAHKNADRMVDVDDFQ